MLDENQFELTSHQGRLCQCVQFHALTCTGGNLPAHTLYHDPHHGVLPKMRKLCAWFEAQRSVQFFQASVLITYEGGARSAPEAKLQVRRCRRHTSRIICYDPYLHIFMGCVHCAESRCRCRLHSQV